MVYGEGQSGVLYFVLEPCIVLTILASLRTPFDRKWWRGAGRGCFLGFILFYALRQCIHYLGPFESL